MTDFLKAMRDRVARITAVFSADHSASTTFTSVPRTLSMLQHYKTAPWLLCISSADLTRLTAGFQPQQMEDRWLCCAEDTAEPGVQVVRFHKSWTGQEHFSVRVRMVEKSGGKHSGEITEIAWDEGKGAETITEDDAKDIVIGLCKSVLGCSINTI